MSRRSLYPVLLTLTLVLVGAGEQNGFEVATWKARLGDSDDPSAIQRTADSLRQSAQEAGDTHGEAALLDALGRRMAELQALHEAKAALLAAAHRYRALDATLRSAQTLERLASIEARTGASTDAAASLRDARRLYRQLGDTTRVARATAKQANVANLQGKHDQASQLAREALRHMPMGDDTLEERMLALAALGWAEHRIGAFERAEAIYDRLIALAWPRNHQRHLAFAYCNRAEVRWAGGRTRPAIADLKRAIGGFEDLRHQLAILPSERASYLARQVEAYDRLIRYLVDTGDPKQAFDVAERFHARSFLEMLASTDLVRAAGTARPRLVDRYQRLLDKIGRLRLAGARGEITPAARDHELTQLGREQRLLERGLARHDRRFASLVAPEPPTLDRVREALEPGELLLSYWVTADRVLVWALQKSGFHFGQAVVSQEMLSERLERFLEPLANHHRAEDLALRGGEDRHIADGRALHRWLLDVVPGAGNAQRLLIVPDGPLHYLPFEALIAACNESPSTNGGDPPVLHARYAACRMVGLEQAITYGPSAGVLLALRARRAERSRPAAEARALLALAPSFSGARAAAVRDRLAPLRFAAQEAQTVSALFEGARTWLGRDASEHRLKTEGHRFRRLHLATHGLVRDDLPMGSALVLEAGQGEDGLLQASEVLGLELHAELVTLSACRTGRGTLARGEGIVGLSQAFLFAGADAVLVSLWDVDDRTTPEFMRAFYRAITEGQPRDLALRDARRALFAGRGETRLVARRREIAYAHPRFWAGFVLVGLPE